jgi:hypothetical protein
MGDDKISIQKPKNKKKFAGREIHDIFQHFGEVIGGGDGPDIQPSPLKYLF